MNLKEIKEEFKDCDWMRAFLNGYTVDAILWLMNRVEELEQQLKRRQTMSVENCGAKQVEEGQVIQELNNAENASSQLSARIHDLDAQLISVLRESVPFPSKGEVKTEETLVPLAHRIRRHCLELQDLGIIVGEILNRLEIR